MVRERRLYPRNNVNWQGQATLDDGPSLDVRVLDVSAGGAKLALPGNISLRRQELLELTATRRSLWPFGAGRMVNALGRVVRIATNEDGAGVTVGVRFHTPLRQSRRLTGLFQFPSDWSLGTNIVPSA